MPLGYDVERLKALTRPLDYSGTDSDVSFDLRWDDMIGEIIPGTAVSAPAVDVYRDTPFRAYHFVHNQDDDLHFRFQMSHRWNRGETRLHAHFIPCVNPASPQYVVWDVTYAWAGYGVELGVLTAWTTVEARSTIGTTDQFKPTITPLATIAAREGAGESDILCVRLRRLGSSAPTTAGWTDTYTTGKAYGTAAANVMLLSCDLHFQAEKIGTTAEYPT